MISIFPSKGPAQPALIVDLPRLGHDFPTTHDLYDCAAVLREKDLDIAAILRSGKIQRITTHHTSDGRS